MNMLAEFMENTDDLEIKSTAGLVFDFYKHNKSKIPFDEREDFQQDIILCVLRARKKYDPKKGTLFSLLCWELKPLLNDLISKYVGIRMNCRQYQKFKKENRALIVCSLKEKEV